MTPHIESCRQISLAAVFAAKFDFKSLVLLAIDDLRYDYATIIDFFPNVIPIFLNCECLQ